MHQRIDLRFKISEEDRAIINVIRDFNKTVIPVERQELAAVHPEKSHGS